MRASLRTLAAFVTVLVAPLSAGTATVAQADVTAVRLVGRTVVQPQYFCGYLNLSTPTDFHRGERLRVTLGGSAQRAVIRLLPMGFSPDAPDVVIEPRAEIGRNRVVEIVLDSDYRNIVQISAHGGSKPFDQFSLGDGNGPATVLKVERLAR